MLVLTRRIGEEIVIADDIRVKIVGVNGQKVRLGITAAPSISVDRDEIRVRRREACVSPASTTPFADGDDRQFLTAITDRRD